MTDAQRLFGVRLLHTVIYVVMATASLLVLYGGISGAAGTWLTVAVALVVIETLVFAAGGLKCPLTAVAVKYGAGQDGLFDTFLPERIHPSYLSHLRPHHPAGAVAARRSAMVGRRIAV